MGLRVAVGYLDEPPVLVSVRDALANGAPPEWYSHLFVDDASRTVVGFGGYKGPPVEGEVEIGYSVAPSHQRRGHATEAVRQLVDRARARGIHVVSAHTLPSESASTRILVRAGFVQVGIVADEDLGDLWRWELALGPRPAAPRIGCR